MNPAVTLLCLRQGNRTIENYVFEFLEISNHVDFNEVALNNIFRHGLNAINCLGGKFIFP